jgi:hypothetical protein
MTAAHKIQPFGSNIVKVDAPDAGDVHTIGRNRDGRGPFFPNVGRSYVPSTSSGAGA